MLKDNCMIIIGEMSIKTKSCPTFQVTVKGMTYMVNALKSHPEALIG